MRWSNLPIPPGATIVRASIVLTAKATGAEPASVRLYGHDTDNAAAFTAQTARNLSTRQPTSAVVDWLNIPAWTVLGETHQTPDLAPIVQEIVNRAGWRAGNSLAILATLRPGSANDGPRTAVAYDGNAAQAPLLRVAYTTGGHPQFISDSLTNDDSPWRICSWHKVQRLIQVGDKQNETGWDVYEACRQGRAIIATGHNHAYARTCSITRFADPPVHNCQEPLLLDAGTSFAFVAGLGGYEIVERAPELVQNPWWGFAYDQNPQFGALFCTFESDGLSAGCYFKNIDNTIVDAFTIQQNR
jgi:hypothetical protein